MKIKRMQMVRDMASQTLQRATDSMHQAQHALHQQQKQHQDLQRYYDEYQKNQAGITRIAELRNRQAFLEKLLQAIEQQQQQVTLAQQKVVQCQSLWREAKAREKALEKVVERLIQEKQQRDDRVEQLQSDERALGKALYSR